MKIIITAPSLNTTQNVSGISSVVQFIIKTNSAHQYIHFLLGKKDDEKRNIRWLLRIIKVYVKWTYLMITSKNAIIHFNLAVDRNAVLRDIPLILIARVLRKRMVYHLHGGEFSLDNKMPVWMKNILKFVFSAKNPKIVLSQLDKEYFKAQFNCDQVFVLANCINLDEASQFNRDITKYEMPVLLFMGRISLNKGIEYIFLALESLQKQHQNFKFILAGKGPDMAVYVKKFTELLGTNFTYAGVVSGVQKTELLKNCNVFLLPSFFEGLPIALLESMSFGLVPITTNVGSIGNLVENNSNGILVNKYSSAEIVTAIQRISANKEYNQKLSTNARQYIFNNYDPTKYIAQLNEIYNYE